MAAGASEVIVFDHTCDDWRKCYKNSGIEDTAKAAGAKVVPAHEETYYRSVSLPNAKNMKTEKYIRLSLIVMCGLMFLF